MCTHTCIHERAVHTNTCTQPSVRHVAGPLAVRARPGVSLYGHPSPTQGLHAGLVAGLAAGYDAAAARPQPGHGAHHPHAARPGTGSLGPEARAVGVGGCSRLRPGIQGRDKRESTSTRYFELKKFIVLHSRYTRKTRGRHDARAEMACVSTVRTFFPATHFPRLRRLHFIFINMKCACCALQSATGVTCLHERWMVRVDSKKPWALHLRQPLCDMADALRTCRHGALSSTACGLTVVMPTMGGHACRKT